MFITNVLTSIGNGLQPTIGVGNSLKFAGRKTHEVRDSVPVTAVVTVAAMIDSLFFVEYSQYNQLQQCSSYRRRGNFAFPVKCLRNKTTSNWV